MVPQHTISVTPSPTIGRTRDRAHAPASARPSPADRLVARSPPRSHRLGELTGSPAARGRGVPSRHLDAPHHGTDIREARSAPRHGRRREPFLRPGCTLRAGRHQRGCGRRAPGRAAAVRAGRRPLAQRRRARRRSRRAQRADHEGRPAALDDPRGAAQGVRASSPSCSRRPSPWARRSSSGA